MNALRKTHCIKPSYDHIQRSKFNQMLQDTEQDWLYCIDEFNNGDIKRSKDFWLLTEPISESDFIKKLLIIVDYTIAYKNINIIILYWRNLLKNPFPNYTVNYIKDIITLWTRRLNSLKESQEFLPG